jgi:hypothetical protein
VVVVVIVCRLAYSRYPICYVSFREKIVFFLKRYPICNDTLLLKN